MVAQCLRFHCPSTSIAADIAADPWLRNKIPHAAHSAAKKKKKDVESSSSFLESGLALWLALTIRMRQKCHSSPDFEEMQKVKLIFWGRQPPQSKEMHGLLNDRPCGEKPHRGRPGCHTCKWNLPKPLSSAQPPSEHSTEWPSCHYLPPPNQALPGFLTDRIMRNKKSLPFWATEFWGNLLPSNG